MPAKDLLFAGFPCQPFSKAGEQPGFDCTTQGDLFDHVVRILSAREPKYLLLENVPNLLQHDGGETIKRLRARLRGPCTDPTVALTTHGMRPPARWWRATRRSMACAAKRRGSSGAPVRRRGMRSRSSTTGREWAAFRAPGRGDQP